MKSSTLKNMYNKYNIQSEDKFAEIKVFEKSPSKLQ